MPSKYHFIIGPTVNPQLLQSLRFLFEQPKSRFQQTVMDVATIELLHTQAIVQKHLVIALHGEIESPNGQHNLAVFVISVNEIRRRVAPRLLVGDALDDPIGVESEPTGRFIMWTAKIRLVDGEDQSAGARDGFELIDGGRRPGGAVVGANIGAALPHPATKAKYEDALDPASYRHVGEI